MLPECVGGKNCPLGIESHPKAERDEKIRSYPLGCSLCRSEKMNLVTENDEASAGVNLEKRNDMKERFDHVHGHEL